MKQQIRDIFKGTLAGVVLSTILISGYLTKSERPSGDLVEARGGLILYDQNKDGRVDFVVYQDDFGGDIGKVTRKVLKNANYVGYQEENLSFTRENYGSTIANMDPQTQDFADITLRGKIAESKLIDIIKL